MMSLSGNPSNKSEAARWVRIGIELVVINPLTNLPIEQRDGIVRVIGRGWEGIALLKDGIVKSLK